MIVNASDFLNASAYSIYLSVVVNYYEHYKSIEGSFIF